MFHCNSSCNVHVSLIFFFIINISIDHSECSCKLLHNFQNWEKLYVGRYLILHWLNIILIYHPFLASCIKLLIWQSYLDNIYLESY